jgi:hypothetical protein
MYCALKLTPEICGWCFYIRAQLAYWAIASLQLTPTIRIHSLDRVHTHLGTQVLRCTGTRVYSTSTRQHVHVSGQATIHLHLNLRSSLSTRSCKAANVHALPYMYACKARYSASSTRRQQRGPVGHPSCFLTARKRRVM